MKYYKSLLFITATTQLLDSPVTAAAALIKNLEPESLSATSSAKKSREITQENVETLTGREIDETHFFRFFDRLDQLKKINRPNVFVECSYFQRKYRPLKDIWKDRVIRHGTETEFSEELKPRPLDYWYPHVIFYIDHLYEETAKSIIVDSDYGDLHRIIRRFNGDIDSPLKFSRGAYIPHDSASTKGTKVKASPSTLPSKDKSVVRWRMPRDPSDSVSSEEEEAPLPGSVMADSIFPLKPKYWEQAIEAHPHLTRLFPKDIVDLFGRSIIGQNDALRVVARGLHGHFVRVAENERVRESRAVPKPTRTKVGFGDAPSISRRTNPTPAAAAAAASSSTTVLGKAESDPAFLSKSNLVIVGPTGSGKTATLSLIEEMFDVPVILVDGSRVTPEGWRGDDVSNWFKSLLLKAGGDVEKAQRGIICIDEFDKILGSRSDHDPRGPRGIAVQSELLKAVEGAEISVRAGSGMFSPEVKFDTRNIWWIAMGVFDGIEKSPDGKVTHEGLARFGLTRELCGRFTNVCTFNPIDERALVRILQESRLSPLESAKRFLALDPYNITLEIDEAGLNSIARNAFTHGNGSRSLQSIIDYLVSPIIDDAHLHTGSTLKLTEREIEDRLKTLPRVSERKRDEPPPGMYV